MTKNAAYSPEYSMWFGNESTSNYDTGSRVFGSITSEEIDLYGQEEAYLIFYHLRQTQEDPNYDIGSVRITGGILFSEIWNSGENKNINPWEKITIDISSYCGSSTVRIMFFFDTIDESKNYYCGWLVDDIIVTNDIDDDDDDDDHDSNGHKKSDEGIGGGVSNFLLSPIGLITVGGITVGLIAIVIVIWIVKKKHLR